MCVYIYKYIYIYIYIPVYICIYLYICVYMSWGVFLKLKYFDKHDKQSSTTRKRKAPQATHFK